MSKQSRKFSGITRVVDCDCGEEICHRCDDSVNKQGNYRKMMIKMKQDTDRVKCN